MIHLSSDTGDLFEQAYAFSQKQVRKLIEKHPGFYPLAYAERQMGATRVRPGRIGATDFCPA